MAQTDIITQFIGSILYGLFLVTFFKCIIALLRRDKDTGRRLTRPASKAMLVVAILLALVATVDNLVNMIVNLYNEEFLRSRSNKAMKDKLWIIVNYLSELDIVFATKLSDGVLIYRLFVVYKRSWAIIAFPLLICAAGLVSAIVVIYLQAISPALSNGKSPIRELVAACFTITVVLNIYATSLLIRQIWISTRLNPSLNLSRAEAGHHSQSTTPPNLRLPNTSQQRQDQYNRLMRVLIESGLLYTVVATANSISWIIGKPGETARGILGAVDVQVIGIAFTLLTMRVYAPPKAKRSASPHGSVPDSQSLAMTTGGPRFRSFQVTLSGAEFDERDLEDDRSRRSRDTDHYGGAAGKDEEKQASAPF